MTKDSYRAIAVMYDAVIALLPCHVHRTVVEACVRLAPRRVLDVGCGTGTLSFQLASRVSGVVGMDISSAMLKRARAKLRRMESVAQASVSPVFIQGSGSRPPFVPRSFDVALFSLILHESDDDTVELLRQAFTLAPHVVVLEWRMPERNLDYLMAPVMHLVERLAGRAHYRNFRSYMRQGGLHGLAQRVGASIVAEQSLMAGAFVVAALSLKK